MWGIIKKKRFSFNSGNKICILNRDVAPEGATLAETNKNLDEITDLALELQKKTGVKLLWATCNLFAHSRYVDFLYNIQWNGITMGMLTLYTMAWNNITVYVETMPWNAITVDNHAIFETVFGCFVFFFWGGGVGNLV